MRDRRKIRAREIQLTDERLELDEHIDELIDFLDKQEVRQTVNGDYLAAEKIRYMLMMSYRAALTTLINRLKGREEL
ncbi:hypothetical protein [Limosilactobacillus mucosae]|uniref:hypothetical protein n=1 Tax=Limosilactobacillus mucosae TaxID=97478 RepID=UPI001F57DA50|nr:hypothetical protein [Limosilactobacillus mucosae]UNL61948.1 hypothetical protein G8B17_06665 [Limosilactobacillus mucosae]